MHLGSSQCKCGGRNGCVRSKINPPVSEIDVFMGALITTWYQMTSPNEYFPNKVQVLVNKSLFDEVVNWLLFSIF